MLLKFKNKQYEFLFETDIKNIKIIDYDTKDIIEILEIDNYLEKYTILIKNNCLKLIYNNKTLFNILLIDEIELNDISIKSNTNTNINYTQVPKINIFNMFSSNIYINKEFYINNYENYYVQSLTDFIFNH